MAIVSLMCVGPTKKYKSPRSVLMGISKVFSSLVKITVLFAKSTLMLTTSPVKNWKP